MSASGAESFLDRPVARLAALGVAGVTIALLFYINRQDFLPGSAPVSPAETAYLACVSERHGQVDAMIEDGVVTEAQAATFKGRAEALCRATAQ
ncbi:hypothetical protein [Pelagibius sp. Alg239-R121]|uniref:hypothetical protein n=1 Tax=Pelagibius sp. Alg239-R121 TaxID=2993448 RepID=UPI0024A6432B|nr:hypothetical protein [Pelagibius sp. Alg239-R121]